MRVAPHHSVEELKQWARKSRFSQGRQRINIILLAKQKLPRHLIAKTCGCCRAAVDYWVKRYNEEGLGGLRNRPRKARMVPFSGSELERFCARIEAGPDPSKEKTCALRGREVQRILKKEFNTTRSLSATYRLLHRLGYRLLVPRPQHALANPAAQADFKKNFLKGSKHLLSSILIKNSRSGLKMKPGLVNKAP